MKKQLIDTLQTFGICSFLLFGCSVDEKQFKELSPAVTGIQFINEIRETESNNIMTYEYTYNGGGVAVGDFDGDGLPDLYLSGNSVPNKLFINQGNWKFDEVTEASQLSGRDDWATGVNVVDINGDGLLDIYVCYSGNAEGEGFNRPVIRDHPKRGNQLFINLGNNAAGVPVFEDQARRYGLDAPGTFSTQSYFLDYDRDGDLDMFLLNHANMFYTSTVNVEKLRSLRHPYFGNKLYRNDGGHFVEVSEEAGLHGSGLNFGLSAAMSDFNNDSWPDIYVTNDYDEQDYLYINNQDGTFREVSHVVLKHMSKFGMGSDVADLNNDGLPEIFVADMLPEDNFRQKLLKGGDEFDKHNLFVDFGYHHQYMRNTLQMNRGFAPDSLPRFSEVGQFAGISNTDWSWAPLLADYDNDGWKDLFITNGYLRDYTNKDFQSYIVNDMVREANSANRKVDLLALIQQIPTTKIANYAFKNLDGSRFQKVSESWGLDKEAISNAAAYADFDQDGDLDIIYSNLNESVVVMQNQSERIQGNNYIKLKVEGSGQNTQGIGSKVIVDLGEQQLTYEAFFTRGYQSSVSSMLTIGVGQHTTIDEITVHWPDGKASKLSGVPVNQLVTIREVEAKAHTGSTLFVHPSLFEEVTDSVGLDFTHQENDFVDFKYERLLPYQLSKTGGTVTVGDFNKDGNDDLFFGGAFQQKAQLFAGTEDGNFVPVSSPAIQKDSLYEDTDALFLDANGDGHTDLYVVSGGNEFERGYFLYQDRLYLGDGTGQFSPASQALPTETTSGGSVSAADFDQDGDLDLFVGGRTVPGSYGMIPESMVLRNDSEEGEAKFVNITDQANAQLSHVGMVTDALWVDLTNDGWDDLVVVGEWMPVVIYENRGGKKLVARDAMGLMDSEGWWTTVVSADVDKDGDADLLLGNAGANLQLSASKSEPLQLVVEDLNGDGKTEPLLFHYIHGNSYPLASRDELIDQASFFKKQFLKYETYGRASMSEVLGQRDYPSLKVKNLKSCWLKNDGGQFSLHPLPDELQLSCIQDFVEVDIDQDGATEILAAGNFYPFRVDLGRCDAFYGSILKFQNGTLEVAHADAKVWLDGDIRDLAVLSFRKGRPRLVVSRNDDRASVYIY